MTTLTVYDPPMCCSTGVCGPEIDPKLAQFAGDLDWLKSRGVEVRRFNLAQEPGRFVENAAVKAILERGSGNELPAIVVGDALVASGRYPGRAELAAMAGLETEKAALELTEQIKELIALGAAIAANCEPCFEYHYDKARKLGASADAMREAVRIGEAVKAASAKNILRLANSMLNANEPKAAGSSCCGGPAAARVTNPEAEMLLRQANDRQAGCC